MAAPEESVTVPVIEAVSCAKSAGGRPIEKTRRKKHRRRDFIINSVTVKLQQKPTTGFTPENRVDVLLPINSLFQQIIKPALLKRVNSAGGPLNCQVKRWDKNTPIELRNAAS